MSKYIYVKPKKALKRASRPTNAGVSWSFLVTTMFQRASACWWLSETLLLYYLASWIMLVSGMVLAPLGGPTVEHLWGLQEACSKFLLEGLKS